MTPEVGKFYKVHWGDTYIGNPDWIDKTEFAIYPKKYLWQLYHNQAFSGNSDSIAPGNYSDSIFECVGWIPSKQVEGIQERIYTLKCGDYITFADRVEIEFKLKEIWK